MWNMTNFIHCTHFIIIDDITRCDIIRKENTFEDECSMLYLCDFDSVVVACATYSTPLV